MTSTNRWARRAEFWRSLPTSAYVTFLASVFFMFMPAGILTDIVNNGSNPPVRLLESMLLSGGLAVVYFVIANRPRWFPLLIVGHILVVSQFDRLSPAPTAPLVGEALQGRLRIDTSIVSASLIVSFILLSHFVRREGLKYVRVSTEIALARDIHRLLVPPVARRIGPFEFCGISIASGDVGGDLIDLVEANGHWIGYVADVSGHGVGAGLLMGMAKSSARTQLRVAEPINELLNTLNAVLFDLRKPDMYMTFAGLQFDGASELQFSVAGHLPILRYRPATSAIEELSFSQLPLAMFEGQAFVSAPAQWTPGDLFVILTDGLTEVFDSHDQEFGMDRIKALLRAHGTEPLDRLQSAILDAVKRHGRQLDDQTLLLVRALPVVGV